MAVYTTIKVSNVTCYDYAVINATKYNAVFAERCWNGKDIWN